MKKYIIIGLILLLSIFTIISYIKYSQLEKEYLILKLKNDDLADSLTNENKLLQIKIGELEELANTYTEQIDSLQKLKQTIIVKGFKESAT